MKRGETSGRADDNEEAIVKRFATFREESVPVVEMYDKEGKVKRIDGARDEETVFADVVKACE